MKEFIKDLKMAVQFAWRKSFKPFAKMIIATIAALFGIIWAILSLGRFAPAMILWCVFLWIVTNGELFVHFFWELWDIRTTRKIKNTSMTDLFKKK